MRATCNGTDGVCTQCGGAVLPASERRTCPAYLSRRRAAFKAGAVETIREPGAMKQATTYALAVAKWELAGKPTRTQEEIDAVLAICESCPFYTNDKRPRCRRCGCSVNNRPAGLANKIAMATESCPLDPPKWAATA